MFQRTWVEADYDRDIYRAASVAYLKFLSGSVKTSELINMLQQIPFLYRSFRKKRLRLLSKSIAFDHPVLSLFFLPISLSFSYSSFKTKTRYTGLDIILTCPPLKMIKLAEDIKR